MIPLRTEAAFYHRVESCLQWLLINHELGGSPMLFKSDVPVSHRMALVLAVILTAKVLVDLTTRSAFGKLEV